MARTMVMERLNRFCRDDGPRLAPVRARGGFTLIELMTVILIMSIAAGITIGGMWSFQRGSRLLAAEQLLLDFLRQARHTARSTGAPVILRITPLMNEEGKVTGGEIAGISQIPLVSEMFEDDKTWQNPQNGQQQKSAGSSSSTPQKPFAVAGRSGHGLRIEATSGGTQLVWPSKADTLVIKFADKDRSKRLVRRKGLTEGFFLAAAIRTPPVDEPTLYDAQGRNGRIDAKNEPGYVPLLLIGSESSQSIEDSIAGLMLRRHQRPLQIVDRADPSTGAQSGQILATPLTTWEAVGWVKGDEESAMVSSIDDQAYVATTPAGGSRVLHPTAKWGDYASSFPSLSKSDALRALLSTQGGGKTGTFSDPAVDIPSPIGDGRWVELGLLFDGHELMMFLDGVPMARADAAVTLPFDNTRNALWIGTATLPTLGADPGSGKTIYAASPAIIDDVRLFRLGTDRPTALPKGVRPCLPGSKTTTQPGGINRRPGQRLNQADLWYEITALPDGRVLLHLRTANGAVATDVVNPDLQQPGAGGGAGGGAGQGGMLSLVLAETTQPEFIEDNWAVPAKRVEFTIAVNGRVTKKIFPNPDAAVAGGGAPANGMVTP